MYINKKYKRNVDHLVDALANANKKEVFITSPINISQEELSKIGFSSLIKDGDNVVPSEFGRFTAYNLNGKMVTRRDLPKEMRVVNTIYWTWKTWDGTVHEEFTDVSRLCYPREYMAPPSKSVYYSAEHNYVVSDKMKVSDKDELLHTINIFLEIFGGCNVVDDEYNIIPTQRVPWVIFPQGDNPWPSIAPKLLSKVYGKPNKRKQEFIEARINHLMSFKPSSVASGESSFSNYLAFIFKDKNLVVLESTTIDNATYVFDKDWEACSRLTKSEVINGNLHKERIVHQKSWFTKISNILK